jgi:hypothetical protein
MPSLWKYGHTSKVCGDGKDGGLRYWLHTQHCKADPNEDGIDVGRGSWDSSGWNEAEADAEKKDEQHK